MEFEAAWKRGHAMLRGAERIRLPGGEPGVEIAALDWGGEGELVVMHHANGFCGATLAPLATGLCDRYRVVCLDARGHGASTPVDPLSGAQTYHWERLAADAEQAIHGLLERTGRERVALAIGHSFGGTLLLRAAEHLGTRIERLLLCDPVLMQLPGPGQPRPAMRGNPMAEATRKRRDHFPDRSEAFAHCRTRGLFADFTPEALALYVGEGMRDAPGGGVTLACNREVEAAIFEGGAYEAVVRDLDRVRARVLFVHAQRGNFSREYYDVLAGRIGAAEVRSEDIGHLFPLEVPERALAFAEALLRAEPASDAVHETA